jgi:hypothetical protein
MFSPASPSSGLDVVNLSPSSDKIASAVRAWNVCEGNVQMKQRKGRKGGEGRRQPQPPQPAAVRHPRGAATKENWLGKTVRGDGGNGNGAAGAAGAAGGRRKQYTGAGGEEEPRQKQPLRNLRNKHVRRCMEVEQELVLSLSSSGSDGGSASDASKGDITPAGTPTAAAAVARAPPPAAPPAMAATRAAAGAATPQVLPAAAAPPQLTAQQRLDAGQAEQLVGELVDAEAARIRAAVQAEVQALEREARTEVSRLKQRAARRQRKDAAAAKKAARAQNRRKSTILHQAEEKLAAAREMAADVAAAAGAAELIRREAEDAREAALADAAAAQREAEDAQAAAQRNIAAAAAAREEAQATAAALATQRAEAERQTRSARAEAAAAEAAMGVARKVAAEEAAQLEAARAGSEELALELDLASRETGALEAGLAMAREAAAAAQRQAEEAGAACRAHEAEFAAAGERRRSVAAQHEAEEEQAAAEQAAALAAAEQRKQLSLAQLEAHRAAAEAAARLAEEERARLTEQTAQAEAGVAAQRQKLEAEAEAQRSAAAQAADRFAEEQARHSAAVATQQAQLEAQQLRRTELETQLAQQRVAAEEAAAACAAEQARLAAEQAAAEAAVQTRQAEEARLAAERVATEQATAARAEAVARLAAEQAAAEGAAREARRLATEQAAAAAAQVEQAELFMQTLRGAADGHAGTHDGDDHGGGGYTEDAGAMGEYDYGADVECTAGLGNDAEYGETPPLSGEQAQCPQCSEWHTADSLVMDTSDEQWYCQGCTDAYYGASPQMQQTMRATRRGFGAPAAECPESPVSDALKYQQEQDEREAQEQAAAAAAAAAEVAAAAEAVVDGAGSTREFYIINADGDYVMQSQPQQLPHVSPNDATVAPLPAVRGAAADTELKHDPIRVGGSAPVRLEGALPYSQEMWEAEQRWQQGEWEAEQQQQQQQQQGGGGEQYEPQWDGHAGEYGHWQQQQQQQQQQQDGYDDEQQQEWDEQQGWTEPEAVAAGRTEDEGAPPTNPTFKLDLSGIVGDTKGRRASAPAVPQPPISARPPTRFKGGARQQQQQQQQQQPGAPVAPARPAGSRPGRSFKPGRTFKFDANEPAFSSARHGHLEALQEALEDGLSPDTADHNGNSFLIIAAQNNQPAIIQYLAEHGANINKQNKLGNTALHYACAFQFTPVAALLDGFGADDGIPNDAGELPCQFQGKRYEQPRPPDTARF